MNNISSVTIDCPECEGRWPHDTCPYCGHDCEIVAYTYNHDEDAFCHKCKKISVLSVDGTKLERL